MKDKVEFRKLREFGELIGDTFLFMKQNFKPLMKSFFALTGIFIAGSIISSIMAQLQLVGISQASGRVYDDSFRSMLANIGLNYILVIIFVLLTYTSMYVSVLSFVALYIEKGNEAPTVEEVWSYYKHYFFRVLGSMLAIAIILGLIVVVFFVIVGSINQLLAVFSALIIVLPLFVYIFPMLTLFYPTMIMENSSLWDSSDRSFRLTKNQWWITAAVILVINLIFYAFSTMVQLPAIIIMMIGTFTEGKPTINNTYAVISAVSQQISYIFMIIPIICSALIYFNLVERKENLGLLQRMDGLGQHPEADQATQEEY